MTTKPKFRENLHEIIFEADTPAGKAFDVALIVCIIMSVVVVMLDSVHSVDPQFKRWFYGLEWFFTGLFTVEYLLRLYLVKKPLKYATSFFGIVDLLSILPTWLSLLFPETRYLLVIRTLRTIRIWRILKLVHYLKEFELIVRALRASARKIAVFLVMVLTLILIMGSLMYMVESKEDGFTSIPRSVYWAVVTLTTVGYGDISPQTNLGQALASLAMILGYAIIAVPTGIVTVELGRSQSQVSTQHCPHCSREGHEADAIYCKYCGKKL